MATMDDNRPVKDRRANARQHDPAALMRLVESAPLAWVMSPENGPATLLPLIPKVNQAGEIKSFAGHFSVRNPHVEFLRRHPEASLLFSGPNAFISSSWLSNTTLAPTWFYVAARFQVDITFKDTEQGTRDHLDDLVISMESRSGSGWRTTEMGSRFEGLSRGVTSFHAHVRSHSSHFALGANENPDVLDEMIDGLRTSGQEELASWVEWLGRS